MSKNLEELLLESVQDVAGVAPNLFLSVRFSALVNVMRFVEGRPEAAYASTAFRALFSKRNWILDAQRLETFFQLVGEVEFWMLADRAHVALDRIPETEKSTPDFRVRSRGSEAPRFEVKTLSVTGGWRALAEMAEGSFRAQAEVQERVNAGARFAHSVQSVAPHGPVNVSEKQTLICRHLIDKASNNIKLGQFEGAPTFLVLNLILIDGYYTGLSDLRPVAPGYPEKWSVRTGALWSVGFGLVEQLVHGVPEFEGMPAIEGKLERVGVLVHPDHAAVAGIFFVVHRLGGAPRLYGLRRSEDETRWESGSPELLLLFRALVGTAWNNDVDANGWSLHDDGTTQGFAGLRCRLRRLGVFLRSLRGSSDRSHPS